MGGLAVGLGSCLLIAYFLYNEFSFDHFHEQADHIYRINTIYSDHSGSTTQFVNTPPALGPGLTGVIPELKNQPGCGMPCGLF
jgi:putative ABC transport system permease protein